jgi:hypothetical protein
LKELLQVLPASYEQQITDFQPESERRVWARFNRWLPLWIEQVGEGNFNRFIAAIHCCQQMVPCRTCGALLCPTHEAKSHVF